MSKHLRSTSTRICLFIFLIAALSIAGCSQDVSQFSPTAPITEPAIPARYTAYTDEANLFSISYPPEWETALSFMKEAEKAVKELINNANSGLPVEKASLLFLAGLPNGTGGYSPNVNITVEPMPAGVQTNEQGIEAEIKGVKQLVKDYHELSRTKTTAGGREATIIVWEGTFLEMGKVRCLQMFVLADRNAWVVTCQVPGGDFRQWEGDFNSVARSLRISK